MKARIVPTAEQFVGWVKESTGENDGPWVEAIQRVTGNKRGDPWCASFVAFVLGIAYRGAYPLPRTASCDTLLKAGLERNLLTDSPEPGDVFFVMRAPHDAVHTGFVTAVSPVAVKTIEGNTNPGGSRDGWGVFARERRREKLVFLRVP